MFVVAVGGVTVAKADVIASFTGGTTSGGETAYWGEEVLTEGGGPWFDLTYNVYDESGNPEAGGTIYPAERTIYRDAGGPFRHPHRAI